jgi:hypothetical protein
MKQIFFLYVVLLLNPIISVAQPLSSDDLIRQLSSCDAKFFRAIKENDSNLRSVAPIAYRGEIAFWIVPDRKVDEKSMVMFSAPIDGKVKLIGYTDDIVDLDSMGMYYSWGFLASGSPESLAKAIKPMIDDGNRLRKDGDVYVRSEIRSAAAGSTWEKNDNLAGGAVPRKGTIERVFLLEDAGDKYPGVTRISCSLQGSVTPQLLATERPDIEL